jgi:hypothetical protein
MFTIILGMPPGIALEIVGISIVVIPRLPPTDSAAPHQTKPLVPRFNLVPPHHKFASQQKSQSPFRGGWLRQKLFCGLGPSYSARHPQSGLSFTASPPREAASKGEAEI